MAGISASQIAAELTAYASKEKKNISAGLYDVPVLDNYLTTLTKINGKYPSVHSITSNILQRFRPQWDELGTTFFVPKILSATAIKINYPIVPADVMSNWLAFLYDEKTNKESMPISKYIIEQELLPKAQEDFAWLMINGKDDANPYGVFEFAFPGIVEAIDKAVNNSTNPSYLIPLTTITEANAYDQLLKFERSLPSKAKRHVKQIFVSENVAEMYAIDVKNSFGQNTTYKDTDMHSSPLGKRPVVGIPYLPDNIVYGVYPKNQVKLVDLFNKPEINDIQVQDYKVKVFGEMQIGVDFLVNQALFVANFDDSDSGFAAASNPAAMKKLYFVE